MLLRKTVVCFTSGFTAESFQEIINAYLQYHFFDAIADVMEQPQDEGLCFAVKIADKKLSLLFNWAAKRSPTDDYELRVRFCEYGTIKPLTWANGKAISHSYGIRALVTTMLESAFEFDSTPRRVAYDLVFNMRENNFAFQQNASTWKQRGLVASTEQAMQTAFETLRAEADVQLNRVGATLLLEARQCDEPK